MSRTHWAPLLSTVTAAVLWGSIGIAYKIGVSHGASGAWLILGRPLLASVASIALVLTGRGSPTRWSAVIGLFGLAPLYVSYFLAVERVGAALASLLLYTAPIWVIILSPVIVGEGIRALSLAAAGLGVVGTSLVTWKNGDFRGDATGVALGLLSGASYAAYIVLARLAQKRGASVQEASVHAIPFAAIGVAIAIRPEGWLDFNDLAFALYLAVAGTIIPYFLHVRALKSLRASTVSVVSLVEPLTAVLLAVTLLGERMTGLQLAGASMILAAAFLASTENEAK